MTPQTSSIGTSSSSSRVSMDAVLARAEDRTKRLRLLVNWTFALSLILTAAVASLISVTFMVNVVNKQIFKTEIRKAISNGADLRTLKQIYMNRKLEKKIRRQADEYYSEDIPLSVVLEDIRADSFLSAHSENEKALIVPLDKIIDEHTQTNPFDKLESSQKEYFENVRIKTGNSYPNVQADINKIADELYNKNTLVTEYMRDFRTSFWISIIALSFSLVIGFINIYMTRASRLQRLVGEEIFAGLFADSEGSEETTNEVTVTDGEV